MPDLRVIFDPPRDGPWNMAADEWMFQTVAETGMPILRFYQWTPATLSLGYFQSLEERDTHPASAACPVVRRSTGGGAIVHDRELTYSFAMPLADRWSKLGEEVYDLFHNAIIAVLAEFGMAAQRFPQTLRSLTSEPFLCFQRRASGDVVVNGHKVLGSAQRRRQGALLQHGSLLLEKSPAAPELPGLRDLGLIQSLEAVRSAWLAEVSRLSPLHFSQSTTGWDNSETLRIAEFMAVRYGSPEWLLRRA